MGGEGLMASKLREGEGGQREERKWEANAEGKIGNTYRLNEKLSSLFLHVFITSQLKYL
jgi:hypothetical protein